MRRFWPLLILLAGCGRSGPPPHVFVFLVDTVRQDHLGCYGYERDTSPNLDAFAEDAFVFTAANSSSPWTRPAVVSLFTGLPPQLHGVRGREGFLPASALTWAEEMGDAGYHCAAWFTNANLEPHFGLQQGFDEYSYEERPGRAYLDGPGLVERWRAVLETQPADRPLLHYLHLMDPHQPYLAEREYREKFVLLDVPWREWFDGPEAQGQRIRHYVNTYDAEILQADAAFGAFLATLRERGWYENSWIVFLSDHGEEFFEHGQLGHGHALWENLLQVPLVIRPPGGRQGRDAGRLEQLVDAPVPIHAVADIVAGPGSAGLGRANLANFGVTVPEAWIPTPDAPAPELRRSSFSLDGSAGMAVAQGTGKLIWNENPNPGWRASDLGADQEERTDSGQRSTHLTKELEAWSLAGWRGSRLTNTTGDTLALVLRTEPPEALREVRVPVGELPARFVLGRDPSTRQLEWTAAPGQSLVLRIDPGARLTQSEGEDSWIELQGLVLEPVGPPEDPASGARRDMDPQLEEKLRALGYLN